MLLLSWWWLVNVLGACDLQQAACTMYDRWAGCREMVDDIRDLMVTGRRAADRPYRLEWTAPNTFGFVVAPNYVVAG